MLDISAESYRLSPTFAKVLCEPNWRWNTQETTPLDDYDLWYVWSGEGEIILNGAAFPITKGSCLFFRPGDLVSGTHHSAKPLTVTYIHFSLDTNPGQVPVSFRKVWDTHVFETLLSRYVDLLLSKRYSCEREAQLILKQMIIQLLREDTERNNKETLEQGAIYRSILAAAHYIRLNPGLEHRVSDLAARVQLSPRYFSAKFKQILGQKLESYIIQARIERADYLLRSSDMNVTEVAEALGYQNIYFFSKQFKQFQGVSPSSIRRK